jgi:CheY-like chemotaxis protein
MADAPRARSGVNEKVVDVLVVEDDADARAMMFAVLRGNDFLVRAVESAEAAHEAVLARLPDVVVTDLQLGGASGWNLAAALRADARTSHIACIAVTGAVSPRMEVVAHFDAYLRKPVEVELLVELVSQLAAISRAPRKPQRSSR